jgi:hypothetical protein
MEESILNAYRAHMEEAAAAQQSHSLAAKED